MQDDLRALLDGPNYAHLATLMPDGAPHCVPVWVGAGGPYPRDEQRSVFFVEPSAEWARRY